MPYKDRYSPPWVLAVSGGVDSMVLLHVLLALQGELGDPRFIVATFDHNLRAEKSAQDRHFVEEISAKLGLLCESASLPAEQISSKRNVEEFARRVRYRFLAQVAYKHGATAVFTAHHASDQVETVLMHLLRGTGLTGLRGMAIQSKMPGAGNLTLVRPLLRITRAQIEQYAKEHGLIWREDETNVDDRFLRNRLRNHIVPQLKAINPNLEQAFYRLTELASLEDDLIREVYRQQVEPHIRAYPDRLEINLYVFRSLHPALQSRFLYDALMRLGAPEPQWMHIRAAQYVAQDRSHGAQSVFAGGYRSRIEYDRLVIESAEAQPEKRQVALLAPGSEVRPEVPGRVEFAPHCSMVFSFTPDVPGALRLCDAVSSIILRTRQPGDRFAPLRLKGHTQSLKKWFIEEKVPRSERSMIPLIVVDGCITGIVFQDELIPAFIPDDVNWTRPVYCWIENV